MIDSNYNLYLIGVPKLQTEENLAAEALNDESSRHAYFADGGSLLKIYVVYCAKVGDGIFENDLGESQDLSNKMSACIEISKNYKTLWMKFLEWLGFPSEADKIGQLDTTELAAFIGRTPKLSAKATLLTDK